MQLQITAFQYHNPQTLSILISYINSTKYIMNDEKLFENLIQFGTKPTEISRQTV